MRLLGIVGRSGIGLGDRGANEGAASGRYWDGVRDARGWDLVLVNVDRSSTSDFEKGPIELEASRSDFVESSGFLCKAKNSASAWYHPRRLISCRLAKAALKTCQIDGEPEGRY